ncbi:hypothetical protein ACF0H5_011755 [Mactra antiquata]
MIRYNSIQKILRESITMRWVLYLSLTLTLGALVVNMVSVCVPYWLYTKSPSMAYQGLWQRCESASSQTDNMECVLIKLPPEFLDATRVMMLFGFSFYAIAAICAFSFVCCRDDNPSLITAATFLMLFGGILSMIGVIVYGAMYPILLGARGLNLHAGFGLAVVSVLIAFVNTLFYCMAKARGDTE